MRIVCVLDMDQTLGYMTKTGFVLRPFAECFVIALVYANFDIILWSAGTDDYVKDQVNVALPFVRKHAKYLFARTVCDQSAKHTGVDKSSSFIRNLYESEDIFLIGVDDNASSVMDSDYNLRIKVEPFYGDDFCDVELMKVLECILRNLEAKTSLTDSIKK
jgi:hypothetical protein